MNWPATFHDDSVYVMFMFSILEKLFLIQRILFTSHLMVTLHLNQLIPRRCTLLEVLWIEVLIR